MFFWLSIRGPCRRDECHPSHTKEYDDDHQEDTGDGSKSVYARQAVKETVRHSNPMKRIEKQDNSKKNQAVKLYR